MNKFVLYNIIYLNINNYSKDVQLSFFISYYIKLQFHLYILYYFNIILVITLNNVNVIPKQFVFTFMY